MGTAPPTTPPTPPPSRPPTKLPTTPPTSPPTPPPSQPPTKSPTVPPTTPPTPPPSQPPTKSPTAMAVVAVTSEVTFNNLVVPDNTTDFISALETTIARAPDNVDGTTTAKVTRINGNSVGRKLFLSRRLQVPVTTTTVITFEITQTLEVTGDISTVEQNLREDVAAALNVEGVEEVLHTGELQEYGDLSLGKIETDLGDGSDLITETVSPTISNAPTNSPTKKPTTTTKAGKGKKAKTSKNLKTSKTNATMGINPFK